MQIVDGRRVVHIRRDGTRQDSMEGVEIPRDVEEVYYRALQLGAEEQRRKKREQELQEEKKGEKMIMKLSAELSKNNINYPALEGKEDLRFELFNWLKEQNLTVRQAINLLDMTKGEIIEARHTIMDNMML